MYAEMNEKKDALLENALSVLDGVSDNVKLSGHASNGFDRKVFVNRNGNKIKIIPKDFFESYFLEITISDKCEATVSDHSLPYIENLFMPIGTIDLHVTNYFRMLNQIESFYRQMHFIDELCDVIDPIEYSTKCDYRVIRLARHVYLKLIVNPLMPSSVTVSFFGPTISMDHYRSMYKVGLEHWNAEDDIYRNLLRIFELVSFPQKSESSNEFCNICYTYRLGNQIPLISCDNEKCFLIFHPACLQEWFSTIRKSRTFMNVTCGQCPFCHAKLSTSFTQLIEL